ncbi:DUF4350 domain-containing protein [Chloroflexota bacterium]
MKVSSVLFTTVVLTIIISLICIWFYPSIQDFMVSNITWNGINNYSREFSNENIDSFDVLSNLPKNDILVTIPYLDNSDEEMSRIKQFVNAGNTLILMDDYGFGNHILEYLGVTARFTNKPLLDPLFNFKNQRMPRITDFASEVKESGIDVIMLNHASTLVNVTDSAAIAWSSSSSYLDIDENGALNQGEPEGPFVVAAEFRIGKGILILVSDPSIIINSMVGKDNNYDFIRYLTNHTGEQGKIMIDSTHLTKMPLDVSKMRLIDTRKVLSSPYSLLGITAMIFIVVVRYTLKKGDIIG